MVQRLIKLLPPGWRNGWALGILAAAVAMRVCLLLTDVSLSGDAMKRYYPLAMNLLAGHGFSINSAPPYTPHGFDQPGYPVFVAAIFWVLRNNLYAVVLAQIVLELATLFLMVRIVRALKLPQPVEVLALASGLLCPFLTLWSTRLMTEVLATFAVTLACYTFVLAATERTRHAGAWVLCGLASGACMLIRPDLVIAVLLMAIVAAVTSGDESSGYERPGYQKPDCGGWRRVSGRLATFALTVTLVMTPWTLRNYNQFGLVRPLGTVVDFQENGYIAWLGTWVDDTTFQQPYWWNVLKPIGPERFPSRQIPDDRERRRAMDAIALARRAKSFDGLPSRQFMALANEAKRRRPWQTEFMVPLRRTVMTWIRLPDYMPVQAFAVLPLHAPVWAASVPPKEMQAGLLDVLHGVWKLLLICMLLGSLCSLFLARKGVAILFALILGRSLLPFVSGIGTEPRYLLEALPACFILMALGLILVAAVLSYFQASVYTAYERQLQSARARLENVPPEVSIEHGRPVTAPLSANAPESL